MKSFRNTLIAGMAACGAYVGSFYVLMAPNCRAYDANDLPAFNNCPRFSEEVRVPGPLSISTGRANWLNYFYYPFEFIHRGPRIPQRSSKRAEATSVPAHVIDPE